MQSTNSVVQQTLVQSLVGEPLLLMGSLEDGFQRNTTLLDIINFISADAGEFVTAGLAELETATGTLAITNGVVDASLTLATGELLAIESFDTVSFLQEEVNPFLETSSGTLTLNDGLANGVLTTNAQEFSVTNFDFATIAADALSSLLASIDTTIPMDNGVLYISADTALGPIQSAIDITGGDLDVAITSFAGDYSFSVDFPEMSQFFFDLPAPFEDAAVNLNSGNLETSIPLPVLPAIEIKVPLSSVSGTASLADGVADLNISLQLANVDLPEINATINLADTVREATVDFLTGLSGNLSLDQGQLNMALNNSDGSSLFVADLDLLALNSELITFAQQTNGAIELADGLFSGQITVADNVLPVNQSVSDLTALLNRPIDELVNPPTALIGELA